MKIFKKIFLRIFVSLFVSPGGKVVIYGPDDGNGPLSAVPLNNKGEIVFED